MGVHNLTVNELNFIVYFTLHRNEKTIGEMINISMKEKLNLRLFYI